MSRRAARGDSAAFAILVEKYERQLRSFLTRAVGRDLADDIAQEAFIKAWRAAGQYDGRARYPTWLAKIAWRCRIDAARKSRIPEAGQQADSYRMDTGEVQDMLARLNDKERAALVLCEGHGWTHSEAAELLDMPLGTLKSTVARAKARCRAMWEGTNHG